MAAGWDARLYDLPTGVASYVASPDGQHSLNYGSDPAAVLDTATGATHPMPLAMLHARWADDNRHICVLLDDQQTSGLADLWWIDSVTGAKTMVGQFGSWAFNGWAPSIPLCSAIHDLAAVNMIALKATGYDELWLVRVSNASVIQDRHLSPYSYPLISPDAQLVAVNDTTGRGATLYRAADWTPVQSSLTGLEVRGMNWDASRLLVVDATTAGNVNWGSRNPRIVDAGGHVFWSAPTGSGLSASLPQPGGPLLAVDFIVPVAGACPTSPCEGRLFLIGGIEPVFVSNTYSMPDYVDL